MDPLPAIWDRDKKIKILKEGPSKKEQSLIKKTYKKTQLTRINFTSPLSKLPNKKKVKK
jgi:hypothetical protein